MSKGVDREELNRIYEALRTGATWDDLIAALNLRAALSRRIERVRAGGPTIPDSGVWRKYGFDD